MIHERYVCMCARRVFPATYTQRLFDALDEESFACSTEALIFLIEVKRRES